MYGKGIFFLAQIDTLVLAQPNYTHANENHIVSRKSSLWLVSWRRLKLEETEERRLTERADNEQVFWLQMIHGTGTY